MCGLTLKNLLKYFFNLKISDFRRVNVRFAKPFSTFR